MMELGEAEDWVQQPSQNSKLAEHNFRGEKNGKQLNPSIEVCFAVPAAPSSCSPSFSAPLSWRETNIPVNFDPKIQRVSFWSFS